MAFPCTNIPHWTGEEKRSPIKRHWKFQDPKEQYLPFPPDNKTGMIRIRIPVNLIPFRLTRLDLTIIPTLQGKPQFSDVSATDAITGIISGARLCHRACKQLRECIFFICQSRFRLNIQSVLKSIQTRIQTNHNRTVFHRIISDL